MRALTVLFAIFFSVSAGPISPPDDDLTGINSLIGGNLTSALPYEAKEGDIKFYFASRENRNRVQVDARDPNTFADTSFSPEKDTWFVVHGWKTNSLERMEETVGDAILDREDVNVFCVDWSNIAKRTYVEAVAAVPDVGRVTGELIKVLMMNHGLQADRMFLVGHSLGAHIAGRMGADLEGRVSLIVGLDPAGPGFFTEITKNRLDPTDAQFVHVIHTCAAILGFRKPLGHADYYPNGGEFQPGCPVDVTGSCSHSRAYFIYAESLVTGRFLAKSCSSISDYEKGKCDGNIVSEMGGYSPDRRTTGKYYLKTNAKAPFAKG